MTTVVLAGGSAERGETSHVRAARDFGRRVARAGWVLRTGGGAGTSIMGAAADGALGAGGKVEGVILRKFWGLRHRGLGRLRVSSTFATRKAGLFRGVSGAVVFPGGYGTLDELGDLLALKQNGFLEVPLVLLNLGGFWDGLLAWERRAGREGYLYGGRLVEVVSTSSSALACLAARLGRKL